MHLSKKESKKDTFKRVLRVIKKSSEYEKKKSEQKKLKKQSKPKGVGARRAGMVVFWLLFSFMFLVMVVNFFSSSDRSGNQESLLENGKLYGNEGLEYAKSFTYEYFNWSTGKHGKEDLEMRIEPYFLDGIDSLGGVVYDAEWSSKLDKRDIELKEVQEISSDKARFIFKIDLTMRSKTNKKDSNLNEEELSFEELLDEREKVQVINGYKTKTMTKYVSVPVYYSEEFDKFAVFNLPSFTYVGEEKLLETNDSVYAHLGSLQVLSDNYTENNINSFLTTFFESYSRDSKDKLSYILEDERHEYGLGGSMDFVEMNNSTIYIIDDNHDRFLVNVEVKLAEPTTKYEFNNNFLVVVKRKDQRYVVEALNDEKYAFELAERYLQQHEEENGGNSSFEDDGEEENGENEYQYQEDNGDSMDSE